MSADSGKLSMALADRETRKWIWHDARTGRVWRESPPDSSPMPPSKWAGHENAMQNILRFKAEEDRKNQPAARTTHEDLWAPWTTRHQSMGTHAKAEEDSSKHGVSRPTVLRSDGIRKKNTRFEIPRERNLGNIDALIMQCTDEQEKKELRQQKRLLRNRQAA